MRIAKHPTLNIFAREDGAVLLPPCDAERGKKNAKMDELAGTLVEFLKTLKIAVEKVSRNESFI